MKATFRLSRSKYAASWEFYFWLVRVKALGATKIIFDTANPKLRRWDYADCMERFRSIIEPGPALAGLKCRRGIDPPEVEVDGMAIGFHGWYLQGNQFERLKTVKPPVKCDYTITIRKNKAQPKLRDSNIEAWSRLAEQIGAVLIPDYYTKPIHLHDRMALYAGAKMNFGVCNGPIAILSLTEYPFTMVVNDQSARETQIRNGIPEGTKFPWMLENQTLHWQDDTFDNLRRMFDEMKV